MKEQLFKTAIIAQDVAVFKKGDVVSVAYQFHAENPFKNIGLQPVYNVWRGSGDKYPAQLYSNALTDFVL